MESYDQSCYDSMVYDKLREAEIQAASTTERRTHEEVMAKARFAEQHGGTESHKRSSILI